MICSSNVNSPRLHLYLYLPLPDPYSPRPKSGLSLFFLTDSVSIQYSSEQFMCMQKSIPRCSLDVCACQCEEHPETSQKETPEGCAMCNADVSCSVHPLGNMGLLTHTRDQTYSITQVLIKAFNSG